MLVLYDLHLLHIKENVSMFFSPTFLTLPLQFACKKERFICMYRRCIELNGNFMCFWYMLGKGFEYASPTWHKCPFSMSVTEDLNRFSGIVAQALSS